MKKQFTFLIFLLSTCLLLGQINYGENFLSLSDRELEPTYSSYKRLSSKTQQNLSLKILQKKPSKQDLKTYIKNLIIASVYLPDNKKLEAINKAISYSQKINDTVFEGVAYLHKSKILLNLNQYKASNIAKIRAEQISGNKQIKVLCYTLDYEAKLMEACGDYQASLRLRQFALKNLYKTSRKNSKKLIAYFERKIANANILNYNYRNAKIIIGSLFHNHPENYYKNLIIQSKLFFNLNNYLGVIKNILLVEKENNNHLDITDYIRLAESYLQLEKTHRAHFYFLKVDSMYKSKKNYKSDLNIYFDYFIAQNIAKENSKLHFHFLNEKNKYHNKFNFYQRHLYKKVMDNFHHTKETFARKTKEKPVIMANSSNTILLFLIILISGCIIRFFVLTKNLNSNYNVLLTNYQEVQEIKKTELKVPKKTIEDIEFYLKKFEKNKEYLNPEISLGTLAIEIKTNTSYLSRSIKSLKNKTYSQYINDLRIDFVLNKLEKSKKYRNRNVEQIAHKLGYHNSESFSKAFYKKTKIHPLKYIHQKRKEYKS